MKTLRDIDVQGKRVLVRVDFNVPMNEAGEITDDLRIRTVLPTLHYLLEHKARVILCTHMGRPTWRKPSLAYRPRAAVLEARTSSRQVA